MKAKFEIHENGDYCENYQQDVYDWNGKNVYSVWDLTDCREDAIIGRCLLDSHGWLDAVEYGMRLAKQGYDGTERIIVRED